MTIRLIGYWKETLGDEYALPQHFEMHLAPDIREALSRFLRSGQVVNVSRGFSHCRYGCGVNGSAEQTDGEWLWPTGLVHYVEQHGVGLPAEVITHVMRTAPSTADLRALPRNVTAEEKDWLMWSAERIPEAFHRALATARAAAEQEVASRVAAEADRLAAQEGLSGGLCARSGCTRSALQSRALCAVCMLWANGTETLIRGQCEADELARVTASALLCT